MQTTLTPQKAPHRTAAWLMIASPVLFAVWFAAAMTVLSGSGVTDSADLTPDKMSTIRLGWMLVWPLYGVALLLGLAGASRLNRALRATAGRTWAVAADAANALAGLAMIGYVVMVLGTTGFTQATLGEHPWWDPSLFVSVVAIVLALVGAAARRSAGRPP